MLAEARRVTFFEQFIESVDTKLINQKCKMRTLLKIEPSTFSLLIELIYDILSIKFASIKSCARRLGVLRFFEQFIELMETKLIYQKCKTRTLLKII